MKMPPPTGRRMAAGAAAMMVCLSLLLQATGHVQVGDVDEYWAQRSQEAHLRDRGAQPLDQLVGTATRYRQDMLARTTARRGDLDVPAAAAGDGH
ncbi:hypothetical protein ACP70R_028110 [Stipagrostis hirtigluma subsp. patula]